MLIFKFNQLPRRSPDEVKKLRGGKTHHPAGREAPAGVNF